MSVMSVISEGDAGIIFTFIIIAILCLVTTIVANLVKVNKR